MEYSSENSPIDQYLKTIQSQMKSMVEDYLAVNQISQTQLAKELGVSKAYVSQVLKGDCNFTLKKMIELSIAVNKLPKLEFVSDESVKQQSVAEPEAIYTPKPRAMKTNLMIDKIQALSPKLQSEVSDYVDFLYQKEKNVPRKKSNFGCLKGKIWMSPDFDTPMELVDSK